MGPTPAAAALPGPARRQRRWQHVHGTGRWPHAHETSRWQHAHGTGRWPRARAPITPPSQPAWQDSHQDVYAPHQDFCGSHGCDMVCAQLWQCSARAATVCRWSAAVSMRRCFATRDMSPMLDAAHMDARWSARSFSGALRALRLRVAGLLQLPAGLLCCCSAARDTSLMLDAAHVDAIAPRESSDALRALRLSAWYVAAPVLCHKRQETWLPCWTLVTWTRFCRAHLRRCSASVAIACAAFRCAADLLQYCCTAALPQETHAHAGRSCSHMDAFAPSASSAVRCDCVRGLSLQCRCTASLPQETRRSCQTLLTWMRPHAKRCSHGRDCAARIFSGALRALRLRVRYVAVLLVRCSIAVPLLCRKRHGCHGGRCSRGRDRATRIFGGALCAL